MLPEIRVPRTIGISDYLSEKVPFFTPLDARKTSTRESRPIREVYDGARLAAANITSVEFDALSPSQRRVVLHDFAAIVENLYGNFTQGAEAYYAEQRRLESDWGVDAQTFVMAAERVYGQISSAYDESARANKVRTHLTAYEAIHTVTIGHIESQHGFLGRVRYFIDRFNPLYQFKFYASRFGSPIVDLYEKTVHQLDEAYHNLEEGSRDNDLKALLEQVHLILSEHECTTSSSEAPLHKHERNKIFREAGKKLGSFTERQQERLLGVLSESDADKVRLTQNWNETKIQTGWWEGVKLAASLGGGLLVGAGMELTGLRFDWQSSLAWGDGLFYGSLIAALYPFNVYMMEKTGKCANIFTFGVFKALERQPKVFQYISAWAAGFGVDWVIEGMVHTLLIFPNTTGVFLASGFIGAAANVIQIGKQFNDFRSSEPDKNIDKQDSTVSN